MQGATTTSMCPSKTAMVPIEDVDALHRTSRRSWPHAVRHPKGAGVFGPQALSFVGYEDYASFHSSFRACDPNTPARDPTDFHHGLLTRLKPSPRLKQSSFQHEDTKERSMDISPLRVPPCASCLRVEMPRPPGRRTVSVQVLNGWLPSFKSGPHLSEVSSIKGKSTMGGDDGRRTVSHSKHSL